MGSPFGYPAFSIDPYLCDCKNCLLLEFQNCLSISESESNDNAESPENAWLVDDESNKDPSQVFGFVDVASFVALVMSSSTELVYFVKIEKKGISKKMLRDCYGHTVLDGEMFFTGKYLQKIRLKKPNKKQFKIVEKNVYVTPDKIFEAFVGIADDLTMNDDEYLQLIERPKM